MPTVNINSASVCDGTSATLTATPSLTGGTFLWSTGATTASIIVTPSSTTTYTCVYTLAGCPGPAGSGAVTVNPLPTVSAGTDQTVCFGSSVTLLGTSAVTYSWDNGISDGTAFMPAFGALTYTLTGTDANGCIDSDQVIVTVIPLPIVSVGNDQTVCFGSTVTLLALGALTFTWDNGITNGIAFTPSVGILTYTVTGTDANGCINTDQVVLTVNPLPIVSAGTDQIICFGSSISLSGTGTGTYTWDNGITDATAFVPSVGTVTYTVIGTNEYGCEEMDQVLITVNPIPEALNPNPVVYCLNTTATPLVLTEVIGNVPDTYSIIWYDTNASNATSIPPIPITTNVGTTTYYVSQISNSTGCEGPKTAFIVNITPQTQTTFDPIVSLCQGTSGVLLPVSSTNIPAITGSWNSSIINTTSSGTTTYTFTPSVNQCATPTSMDIFINPKPNLIITKPIGFCEPETADITLPGITAGSSSSGVTLTYWSNLNPMTPLFSPQNVGDGTYYIQSTTSEGCNSIEPVTVSVYPKPIASFEPTSFVLSSYNAESSMINQSTNAVSYLWYFGDNETSILETPTHIFPTNEVEHYTILLIAISEYGCTDTTFKTISIKEELIFFIPNSFTPDANHFNDVFSPIFSSGYDPYDFSLLIFNRWGQVVFESHDALIGWDGTMGTEGGIAQDGTYTWKIEFKIKDNSERKMLVGHVNLLK